MRHTKRATPAAVSGLRFSLLFRDRIARSSPQICDRELAEPALWAYYQLASIYSHEPDRIFVPYSPQNRQCRC
ncbi:MAG: hypothetical protein KME14_15955 [Tildeniella torsiva UHER 1998/13D]|nr:hypothetical protein [Tildeniella torsiva UHER 1998/13D]